MSPSNEPSQEGDFFSRLLDNLGFSERKPGAASSSPSSVPPASEEEIIRRVVAAMISTGNTTLAKEEMQRIIDFERAVIEMQKHRMTLMQGIAEYSKQYQAFLAANPHLDDKSLQVIEDLHEQNLATMSDRGGQGIAAIDGIALGNVVRRPELPEPPQTSHPVRRSEPFELKGCRAQLAILAITFVVFGILIAQQDPQTNNPAMVPGCLAVIVLFGGIALAFKQGF